MLVTALTLPIEPENMPIMLETRAEHVFERVCSHLRVLGLKRSSDTLRCCGGITNTRLKRLRGGGRLTMDTGRRGRAGPGRREADRRGATRTQIGANHLPATSCGTHSAARSSFDPH